MTKDFLISAKHRALQKNQQGRRTQLLLYKLQSFLNVLLPFSSLLGHTGHVTPHIHFLSAQSGEKEHTYYTRQHGSWTPGATPII